MQGPIEFGCHENDEPGGDRCCDWGVSTDIMLAFNLIETFAAIAAFEFANAGWVVAIRFDFEDHDTR